MKKRIESFTAGLNGVQKVILGSIAAIVTAAVSLIAVLAILFLAATISLAVIDPDYDKDYYTGSSYSPGGRFEVRVYIDTVALSRDSIVYEVVDTDTGRVRDIYIGRGESAAEVVWIDEFTIEINGHPAIDLRKDSK